MKSQVLHTVWCNITGEAAGEIWTWSLLGVKGLRNMNCCFARGAADIGEALCRLTFKMIRNIEQRGLLGVHERVLGLEAADGRQRFGDGRGNGLLHEAKHGQVRHQQRVLARRKLVRQSQAVIDLWKSAERSPNTWNPRTRRNPRLRSIGIVVHSTGKFSKHNAISKRVSLWLGHDVTCLAMACARRNVSRYGFRAT